MIYNESVLRVVRQHIVKYMRWITTRNRPESDMRPLWTSHSLSEEGYLALVREIYPQQYREMVKDFILRYVARIVSSDAVNVALRGGGQYSLLQNIIENAADKQPAFRYIGRATHSSDGLALTTGGVPFVTTIAVTAKQATAAEVHARYIHPVFDDSTFDDFRVSDDSEYMGVITAWSESWREISAQLPDAENEAAKMLPGHFVWVETGMLRQAVRVLFPFMGFHTVMRQFSERYRVLPGSWSDDLSLYTNADNSPTPLAFVHENIGIFDKLCSAAEDAVNRRRVLDYSLRNERIIAATLAVTFRFSTDKGEIIEGTEGYRRYLIHSALANVKKLLALKDKRITRTAFDALWVPVLNLITAPTDVYHYDAEDELRKALGKLKTPAPREITSVWNAYWNFFVYASDYDPDNNLPVDNSANDKVRPQIRALRMYRVSRAADLLRDFTLPSDYSNKIHAPTDFWYAHYIKSDGTKIIWRNARMPDMTIEQYVSKRSKFVLMRGDDELGSFDDFYDVINRVSSLSR